MHSARYPRKPRGGPDELGPEYRTRLSFCCAVDGCRQRVTPPSVRYLARRVYLGVGVRTLARWRRWWQETFVPSSFWQGVKGRFVPPADPGELPATLLERFVADHARDRLVAVLRFLTPITTRPTVGARRLRGV